MSMVKESDSKKTTSGASSSSSSRKNRLIPSSFRKANNLTNDQQTRILRVQAAKIHTLVRKH